MTEFSTTPTIPENINIQSLPVTSIAEADKQLSKYIKRWDEIYRYLRADVLNVFDFAVRRDGSTPMTGDWDVGNVDFTNIKNLSVNENITAGGNITATGYVTGKKSGSFVYALDQETTILAVDTWTITGGTKIIPIIEDFSAAVTYTPGVRYDGAIVQVFKIDWAVSYEMNKSGTTIHFAVFKNGSLITGSEMQTYGLNINQAYNVSGHAAVSLSLGDEMQLQVKATKTGTLTLLHETTTISRLFN